MWRPTTPFVCRSFRPEVSLGPRNNLSAIFKASRLWWLRAIQTRASCYCIPSRRRRADSRFTPAVDNFPRRTTPTGKSSHNGSAVKISNLAAPVNRERIVTRVSAPDRPGNQRRVKNKQVVEKFGMLREPQHERKIVNDIKIPPFVLSPSKDSE